MRTDEIRRTYLDFFKERGHKIVSSALLVPENDPTTLFTGSGMQPIAPYLLGEKHPLGTRIANSQKCFRAQDIEDVGDNRHTTFFEMLGNWSFGDYFKEEQLPWFFEFLTEEIGLDAKKLYVTVFDGAPEIGIACDEEAIQIWQKVFGDAGIDNKFVAIGSEANGYKTGMQSGRIFSYDANKNWWSRAGVPANMPEGEPGGPDSEVFYDFGIPHDPVFGKECHPNCDCGRFLEIGNSVFMEYIKKDGNFKSLPHKNVDFGGGLERICMAAENNPDIIAVSHSSILGFLESASGKTYGSDERNTKAFRVIADHVKAAVFLIGDGVLPSNTDRGYFTRRLIRRSVRFSDILGITDRGLGNAVVPIVDMYKDVYPELEAKKNYIREEIDAEESRFRATLARGLREFEKMQGNTVSGVDAFILFSTYGFPFEITVELAREQGKKVDEKGFKIEMQKHQELSRAGSEQKFKSGLGDTSEISVKYHTATHLLQYALREVFGKDVFQKGSNITPERLRFDFSYSKKMTDEEKRKIEDIVNQKITEQLPVTYEDLPIKEARKLGAMGLFEEKYGELVRVYRIGDSAEFCGGPHAANTGELGHFKIVKEEASSSGVRRIKAVLE